MRDKFKRLLLTTLLTFCLHCFLFAADPVPRPVTVCSGADVIIKGDQLSMLTSAFLWEFYQGDSWISAPGINTEQHYLVSSLHNPSTANIAFTLRRKTVIAGLTEYDSYYHVTVQPIIPITNNLITLPLVNIFCRSGNPATISGTTPLSGSATFIYQWQSSADNITFKNIDGAYSKDYTSGAITATTYLRRIAISDGCGMTTASNSIKLTVASALADNVITAPTVALICSHADPASIKGGVPSGGTDTYIYKWQKSTDNDIFTDIEGATGPDYDPPMLAVTTYFRRSVVSEPCNFPLVSNVVTIQVMPELMAAELEKSSITICSGSGAALSVKNPIVGITYHWYDSPIRTNLLFVGQTYLTEILRADKTYYVASNNGTCSSTSLGIVRVIVSSLPNSNVLANDSKASTCSGSNAVFTVSTPNADFTYNWYTDSKGGTAIGSGSTWTTPSLSATTTFYMEVVNKEGCASATRQPAEVIVMPALQIPLVFVENTTQHSITFKWDPVTGAIGYRVSIDNGLTYINPSSGSSGLTHTIEGLRGSESITILVKAIGSLDCQAGEHSVPFTAETIKEFDDIFLPNAFTPNDDGKNDVVYVRSQTVKTMAFYIYSQWGEQIFFSPNTAVGWDGTYKGSNQPVGVYVYTVKATMNDGRQVNKRGTITLIR